MIVAIASTAEQSLKSLLAANLAVLRARSGRSICVLDTDPRRSVLAWSSERQLCGQRPPVPACAIKARSLSGEIEHLSDGYSDLLINTGDVATQEAQAALLAAHLVLVPVHVQQADLDHQYGLIARLNSIRMFNPSLKVLFVIVADHSALSPQDLAAVRLYVGRVMSASLADTVLRAPCENYYGEGRCVCDAETCDPDTAAEFNALYREIYTH